MSGVSRCLLELVHRLIHMQLDGSADCCPSTRMRHIQNRNILPSKANNHLYLLVSGLCSRISERCYVHKVRDSNENTTGGFLYPWHEIHYHIAYTYMSLSSYSPPFLKTYYRGDGL